MIDFHTHILPGVDDGSSSVEESIEMINELKAQNITGAVLTPHFYAYKTDVESFIDMRDSAVEKLKRELCFADFDLYIGAEVLFFEDLWQIDRLSSLCIKGTDCIMIEMPFQKWQESFMGGIERIVSRGMTPIIAHFDRYLLYKGNSEFIDFLIECGALLQMNSSYINDFFTRHNAVSLVKKNIVTFLGSDCHNMTYRSPNIKKACDYLIKKGCEGKLESIRKHSKRVLEQAEKV